MRKERFHWLQKIADATLACFCGCMTDLNDFEKMEREGRANPANRFLPASRNSFDQL